MVFDEPLKVQPFDPLFAATVASWVRGPEELVWLAPSTSWPLTAAKVVGWCRPSDRPVLMFDGGDGLPCGYAELNPLRDSRSRLWVGHVVIDPTRRGSGLGQRFTRLLVAKGFADPRVEQVVMIVFPDNEVAIRCYEANGFSVVRHEEHRFPPERRKRSLLRMEITRQVALQMSSQSMAQELPA